MPEVVVVGEHRHGTRHSATAVECKAQSSIFEIERDEVDVLNVRHIQHDSFSRSRLQLYTELSPTHHQPCQSDQIRSDQINQSINHESSGDNTY